MGKRELASLACKILGVFISMQGINVFSSVLYVSLASNLIEENRFANVIFSLVYILFGVLLWFFSDKLSALMVTKENHYYEGSGIRVSDIQRVAFSVLGLYFIGSALPTLITSFTSGYFMSGSPDLDTVTRLIHHAGTIAQLIIGLGIFLGSQGLVNFLNYIKTAGLGKPED